MHVFCLVLYVYYICILIHTHTHTHRKSLFGPYVCVCARVCNPLFGVCVRARRACVCARGRAGVRTCRLVRLHDLRGTL